MSDATDAEIANRHWSDAFELFVTEAGGEFRRIGAIDAFLGGIPMPFANGCLVLEEADPEDLDQAITWVRGGNVPYLVRLEDGLVKRHEPVLAAHDLERIPDPMPGMILRPIPDAPDPHPGVTVARVTHETYDEYVGVLIETGLPADSAEAVFPRRLIDTPTNAYFMGILDGRPVGTSVAIRTGDSGGLYSVGTVESARKRGVGRALTWAAVDVIREWGCTSAVLQSSVMGHPMYLAMGFRDAVQYARYRPRAASVSPDAAQATQ
jgi:GNAT superfamily N-acetyltransferase